MQLEKIVLLKLNGNRNIPTLPKEMQSDKKLPLNSEFKRGTRDLIRGFSPEIERITLPSIIGVMPTDVDFANKAKDYWAEFQVFPTVEGIRLNVATEKKKIDTEDTPELDASGVKTGKSITKDILVDYPINPDDYAIWQIALQSSKVAKTDEDLSSLGSFDFYLVDLAQQEEKEANEFDLMDKADAVYMKLTNDSAVEANMDKINWVLELLRDKGEAVEVESLDIRDKKRRLRKIKEQEPLKFTSTVNDPNLSIKAKIVKLYAYGVITKEGKEYFDGNINIGEGKVAVAWFQKAENSNKILALDARLKNAIESKRTV